jgi:hypothetical protein
MRIFYVDGIVQRADAIRPYRFIRHISPFPRNPILAKFSAIALFNPSLITAPFTLKFQPHFGFK